MTQARREILETIADSCGQPPHELFEAVYEQLRSLAAAYMREQRPGHTLQPTALVHEAYVKIAGSPSAALRDRDHFFAVAATAMRQILVSHSRSRGSQKRGGGWDRITLDAVADAMRDGGVDPIDLDEALNKLASLSERQAQIAELRVFGGLELAAIANLLGTSLSTTKNDWAFARAWLKRELLR